MPNITLPALTFPAKASPTQQSGMPGGIAGEVLFSRLLPQYSALVKAQKVFYTSAAITAPVIFSTAGQLGPVIWNKPGSGVEMHLIAIGVSAPTTAWTNTIAGSIGFATNVQATAPTLNGTSAAITAVNAYAGGGPSQMGQIASGSTGNTITVGVLPAPIFLPLISCYAGAITTNALQAGWAEVGGAVVVSPGQVGYMTVSATLTSGVFASFGCLWAELAV